ncbi:MAG: right-handed parallel beta-helix repeat-containing protein [Verrucomicrobiaceae bacterium]|nr:right-handed parallel beta-helix repeat-containing protein [Verrucomicrobiaceae bacterium]
MKPTTPFSLLATGFFLAAVRARAAGAAETSCRLLLAGGGCLFQTTKTSLRSCLLLLAFAASARAASFTVTTAVDEFNTPSGANVSLREALRDAEASPGADTITFAPALSGQTIVLGSEIAITDPGAVTVDASSLSSKLVIDGGPGNNRIFYIGGSATVSIVAIKLTGGNGSGSVDPNVGGVAFNNGGSLTLTLCDLSNNSAGAGGAIYNHYATLVLDRCSFSGHTAVNGGALVNTGSITAQRCSFTGNTVTGDGGVLFSSDGSVSLSHCTLQGNSAGGDGGAIKNFTQLDLTHCTVTGNSAGGIFGGGGIYHVRHYLTVANSIVAGNSLNGTGFGADIRFDYQFNICTLTRVGANIIQSLAVGGTGGNPTGPPHMIANPLLAPLNDYGGPTPTMALLPGSPARNAATSSTITSDQRGFPIVFTPDIGAYESGTLNNYNAWIYETLPDTATVPQHASTFDYDGDGVSNGSEWPARTDPGDASSYFQVTQNSFNGGQFNMTVTTVAGRTYSLETSSDLVTWIPTGFGAVSLLGMPISFSYGPITPTPRLFFRVSVQ